MFPKQKCHNLTYFLKILREALGISVEMYILTKTDI